MSYSDTIGPLQFCFCDAELKIVS